MKKRNIVAVFAALAAAVVLFTACGKNGEGEPEVSTIIGADGNPYEEVTEIHTEVKTEIVTEIVTEVVTNQKGEPITDKNGVTEVISEIVSEIRSEVVSSVVTVTKPYVKPTTTAKGQTTAATTAPSVTEGTTTYEDVTFPEGTKVDVPVDSSGKPKEPLLKKLMGDSKNKKQLYLDFTIVTGEALGMETGTPIKVYIKDDDMAFELTAGLLRIRTVKVGNEVIMILPDIKSYYAVDASTAGADMDYDVWDNLVAADIDYISTTSVKLKGIVYTCETYGDSTNTNKYYFNSKGELKRVEIITSDGEVTIWKVNACSSKVDESIFSIPKGYKEMTEESLQGMLGGLM